MCVCAQMPDSLMSPTFSGRSLTTRAIWEAPSIIYSSFIHSTNVLFTNSWIQCNRLHFLYSSPCPGNLADTLLTTHLTLAVGSNQGGVCGVNKTENCPILKTAEFNNNNKGEYSFLKTVKQLFQQIPVSKEGPCAGPHTFLNYPGCTPSSKRKVIRPFLLLLRGMTWASQMTQGVRKPPANAGNIKRHGFDPWIGKIPWRMAWQLTPEFLPGEFHGQRSLVDHKVVKSRT